MVIEVGQKYTSESGDLKICVTRMVPSPFADRKHFLEVQCTLWVAYYRKTWVTKFVINPVYFHSWSSVVAYSKDLLCRDFNEANPLARNYHGFDIEGYIE